MRFSNSAEQAIDNILRNKFNISDVRSFVIECRQKDYPSLTEIGNQVAHPERDRGKFYDHAVLAFAKGVFLAHHTAERRMYSESGSCEWRLKELLQRQAKEIFLTRNYSRNFSIGEFNKFIAKYFPKQRHPTQLIRKPDTEFAEWVRFATDHMVAYPAMSGTEIDEEIRASLRDYNQDIDQKIVNRLIVGLCCILHNSNFVFNHLGGGRCRLYVNSSKNAYNFIPDLTLSHGEIQVVITSCLDTTKKPTWIQFPVIESRISSQGYLSKEGAIKLGGVRFKNGPKVKFDTSHFPFINIAN